MSSQRLALTERSLFVMSSSKFSRFLMPALAACVAIGMSTVLTPTHASTAPDLQAQVRTLESRIAALETKLAGDGELTVKRLNVHHIAALSEGNDPDYPALIITDALDRTLIGINGVEFVEPKLGFFGAEPHPQPQYATAQPTSLDVAHIVGATGLTDSPVQSLPQP
jgi:hypothetical protein